MGIQGMELCAVAVVILLFIAVLKQFGILEPISVEDSGDADVELPTIRHQPEGLEQLLARTKFTKTELQSLYRGFKNECPSGLVDEETFTLIYSRFFPQGDASSYAHFLFDAFDADRNGALCFQVGIPGGNGCASTVIHHIFPLLFLLLLFPLPGCGQTLPRGCRERRALRQRGVKITGSIGNEIPRAARDRCGRGREGQGVRVPPRSRPRPFRQDFAVGLSVLLRGTEQQKLKWTFDLYDVNKDGYVTKEVTVGNTGGLVGWGHPDGDVPALCVPQDMLEIMKSIYAMMGRCTEPALGASAPAQHVELFFQKMDRNRDGVVTFEEFLATCQEVRDLGGHHPPPPACSVPK
ncbi:calsenilin isoform X4 [Catharus ustulatus]|uniref:calsenilin isoform X4 n=1 Tax=Catharus ustulatus TaxID=91951 RepID=UPI00140823A6|nr:calsenilin isoform X4 [Catharus ustulatus]